MSDVSKLLCILIAPYTDTEVAAIVTSLFATLSWSIAKSPTCQQRHDTDLLGNLGSMLHLANVCVVGIVAVCAGGGDTNLCRGWWRLGPFVIEDDGETLTSRCHDALCRTFILERLVHARALRTQVIHRGHVELAVHSNTNSTHRRVNGWLLLPLRPSIAAQALSMSC